MLVTSVLCLTYYTASAQTDIMKLSHRVLPLVLSTILSLNAIIVPAESSSWFPIQFDDDTLLDLEDELGLDLEDEPDVDVVPSPSLPLQDEGDLQQAQLQLVLMTDQPNTASQSLDKELAAEEPPAIVQCPPPNQVECASPEIDNSHNECTLPGSPCDKPAYDSPIEHCCVDSCSRNYCTANIVVKKEDDLDSTITDKPIIVEALPDKATTSTGQPITLNVLFNDYVQYDNENFGVDFGSSSLHLSQVVSNGIHGSCTITDVVGTILYTPNPGYSGSDKCGYKVCYHSNNGGKVIRKCNFATISITIAKQVEELEFVVTTNGTRPDDYYDYDDLDGYDDVDSGLLLTDDVWQEVADAKEDVEDDKGPSTNNVGWQQFEQYDSECPDNEVLFTIELQTDRHGGDVTWELLRDNDAQINNNITANTNDDNVIFKRGPYTKHSFDQVDICLSSPMVATFTIYDDYGDGICTKLECGYYKLYLDGREIVHVTHYGVNNTHSINVGYDPYTDSNSSMTRRNLEYLHAHNKRRRKWHGLYNTSYVPLMWSPKLAEESLRWAVELLDACDSDGIEHEPGVPVGENLAKNKGLVKMDGEKWWGQLYPPEKIVGRWVDREVGWAYPDNAHLTQALWRASRYMGCGESEKDYSGGKCRVQVCRYARAGNCDMSRYNSTEGENWLIPMLKGSSPCEPSCPPEGCY